MRKTIYLFKFQVSYVHFIMLPLVQNSTYPLGFPWWLVKSLLAMQKTQEMRVQSLGREDTLEKGMATHSSILAWRIPWIGEPGGLQSMGLQRVGHSSTTNSFTSLSCTIQTLKHGIFHCCIFGWKSNHFKALFRVYGKSNLGHLPS